MTYRKQTLLSQPTRQAPQFIATVQPPVYHASTIIFPDIAALTNRHWTDRYDYSYGTHGTPTTYSLADAIAQLEGAVHCLLAPSGLAAIHLVNSTFLNSGDEVWLPDNVYGPNREHLQSLSQKYQIILKIYDVTDLSTLQFSSKSRLVWIEAAGSVTLEFPDIVQIIRMARQHQVLTALDNTWGAGLAFQPFDLDEQHTAVDISVHALTKYPSGGGDTLMGSICTKNHHLHQQLLKTHALHGITVNGDDAAQIYRSLPHIALRYRQHHQNTWQIVEFLQSRREIAQVLHPALPQHVGHQHWQALCPQHLAAGLVSIIFPAEITLAQVQHFCQALRLFHLGFSWGGPSSLVMYYDVASMRQFATPHLQAGWLVRLCIGLEQPEDLIADLDQALQQLQKA